MTLEDGAMLIKDPDQFKEFKKTREEEMVEEDKLRTESKKTVYVSDLVGINNQNFDQKILTKELLAKRVTGAESNLKKLKDKYKLKPPTEEELQDPDMFKKLQLKRREMILKDKRLRAKKTMQ